MDDCPFRAFASWNRDKTKYMKSLQREHNCGRASHNKQVRSAWIIKKYLEFFRDDPNFKVKVLKAMIWRYLKVCETDDPI